MLKESIKYSFWINISQLINLLTSVLFAGMSIRYLGIFNTGILISTSTITSWTPLFGIGSFNESLILLFVKLKNFRKQKALNNFFNGYLFFNALIGIVLAIVTLLFFPLIMKWSKIELTDTLKYITIFIIILTSFCLDQISNSFKILYDVYLKYEFLAISNLYVSLLSNIVKLIVLINFKSVISLAITIFILSFIRLFFEVYLIKKISKISFYLSYNIKFLFNKKINKISYFSWMQNVSNIIIYNITNIILLKNLGVNSIAILGLPINIILQASQFILNSCSFLLPMFAEKKNINIFKIQDSLRWLMSIISVYIFGMIFLFSKEIITLLVNLNFANQAFQSLQLFSIFSIFWSQEIVLYLILLSKGEKKLSAINGLVSSLFVLITMLFFISKFGLITMGISQLTRIPFSFLFIYFAIHKLEIKNKFSVIVKPLLSPFLSIITLILLKIFFFTNGLNLIFSLLLSSVFYLLFVYLFEIIFFFKNNRLELIRKIIYQLRLKLNFL